MTGELQNQLCLIYSLSFYPVLVSMSSLKEQFPFLKKFLISRQHCNCKVEVRVEAGVGEATEDTLEQKVRTILQGVGSCKGHCSGF